MREEQLENEKLRSEVLSQGKQMNSARIEHEKTLGAQRSQLMEQHSSELAALRRKLATETTNNEQSAKIIEAKLRALEQTEKRHLMDKE